MENKKIVAAISAVVNYIKTEETAEMPTPLAEKVSVGQMASIKLWALSGRQAQMQMRSLMEMKAFQRPKF